MSGRDFFPMLLGQETIRSRTPKWSSYKYGSYEEESVNGSHMDIKRKTCDIW
jgi:hypothetical protein